MTQTILVIFGATGDLARSKLFKSLYHLHQKGALPQTFRVVGVSRRSYDNDDFRAFVRENLQTDDPSNIDEFLQSVTFSQGYFDQEETYQKLEEHVTAIERDIGTCPNKLFYLSTPPSFYEVILRHLAESRIATTCNEDEWARILIEKPFGTDRTAARELDHLLGELFREEQIFRIDHYLGKEAVQNILTFRFSNTLFEPLWNRDYIESVHIRMHETADVSDRGSFYDSIGALRDVGQNHILQMLALIALEPCEAPSPDVLRARRAQTLEALKPASAEAGETVVRRAQYSGYRDTPGVAEDSMTETYFSLSAFIDTDRWRDVPFYLSSGKALSEDRVEITVRFRDLTTGSFLPTEYDEQERNAITFRVKPEEEISVLFWVKKPGLEKRIEPRNLSFNYHHENGFGVHIDAYERVLYDCIIGDQTIFPSTQEVTAAWEWITDILEQWESAPLEEYEPGSEEPARHSN